MPHAVAAFFKTPPPTIAANVIVAWPSTNASIPAGWTRETSLDARFVRGATAAGDGGGTGGAATHDHTFPTHSHTGGSHTHASSSPTGAASTTQNTSNTGGANYSINTHTHSPTFDSAANPTSNNSSLANYDATSLDPPHIVVIFIKSNGTPIGLPANCVAYFSGAAPSGWTAYATGADRFLKGAAAAGDGGATGGTSNAHVHTAAHTHTSGGTHVHNISSGAGSTSQPGPNFGGAESTTAHVHVIAASGTADGGVLTSTSTMNIANGDGRPAWKKLLPIQNTGAESAPTSIVAMWLGTHASIPVGWSRLTSVDALFVNGAANAGEVGNTGGAATHTHAAGAGHSHLDTVHGTHTQAVGAAASGDAARQSDLGGSVNVPDTHTHTAGGTAANNSAGTSGTTTTDAAANSSNDPTYTKVIYIQKA